MNAPTAADDEAWMARAFELAHRGLYTTDPNPRVGCVLVRDGRVIAEGWHERAGEAHAEARALLAAGSAAAGATAFVSLEPCSHFGRTPPCADALIAAGVARVHCAVADPNPKVAGAGIRRLREAGIPVSTGLLGPQARDLNVGFFSRFERRRPYVRLKLAMSLDARTAHADGVDAWVSGPESRADVQHWRARSSAVLTGAGTVRADDPRLDVRLEYGPWIRQPLRVVLDPALSCAPGARIFRDAGALVFCADAADFPSISGRRVERVPAGPGGVDLAAVMQRLVELEINELLVECGPRLAAGFLRAALVDELLLYVAPTLLGADALPLTALRGLDVRTPQFQKFAFEDLRRIGDDLRITLTTRRG